MRSGHSKWLNSAAFDSPLDLPTFSSLHKIIENILLTAGIENPFEIDWMFFKLLSPDDRMLFSSGLVHFNHVSNALDFNEYLSLSQISVGES